jgi:hypothetical protein
MTENQVNKDDLLSKFNYEPTDLTKYLPAHMQRDLKMSEIYTDFLLSFLIRKRKGVGKIDQLVLESNIADISLKWFMEKQNATEYKYAEIIKQSDKYVKLKITQEGIWHFNHISTKYRTKSPTLIKRISLYVLKLIRQFWSLVFVSANNRIKTMMESGIIKFILFAITVVTFILKWNEIKQLIHKLTE